MRALLLSLVVACSSTEKKPPAPPPAPAEGAELIGKAPPEWTVTEWLNTEPLTLTGLKGKVVLVRWFMSPDCPLCSATIPSLKALQNTYQARGFTVVGMYHHKGKDPLEDGEVAGYRDHWSIAFPVGIDRDWKTLKSWWLDGHERRFTSVSFLIDRSGAIRHIHPGGRMAPGESDYNAMKDAIERYL
jgi:peroxiredoxin